MRKLTTRLLTAVIPALLSVVSMAEPKAINREYTKEHPLIYEDAWDLYPYSFLNDNGNPDGFNIDLIRMLLSKLDIPYRIELKPTQEAYEDLRDHKSDLMLGLSAGFHDDYGFYGRNSITLFTQSALTPKSKPIEVTRFRDLGVKHEYPIYVLQGSLTYNLLDDYGWLGNATVIQDMKETILQMSATEEGTVIWNSTSLKWLLHKYRIDNLELTPVDMPHGEYRFMSNDKRLMERLDSLYAELSSEDKIVPLHNKWYYPEKTHTTTPTWVYAVGGIVGLLVLLFLFYFANYLIQYRRISHQLDTRNKRLSQILETSGVRLWTYDVATAVFTRRNENGQEAYTYTVDEFAHRYNSGDFEQLMKALRQLINDKAPNTALGAEEKEIN